MKAGSWGTEPFGEGYKRYVLAVLMLCYVANVMDRSVLSMLLEPIRHEFQASDSQLGLLGGLVADLLSRRSGDPRWYMWVPGIATMMGASFFGPSFAVVQALAWGLLLVALVNAWATAHYLWGARSYRADLAAVRVG